MPGRVTRPDPLTGKRVLVTGGSSGIGLACARELTARGARVVLLARGENALNQAAASLDPPAAVVVADVSDVAQTCAAVNTAADLLGGLDAVVANAGAAAYGPFGDMTPDDYGRTISVVLLGTINTAHASLPHLERSGGTLVAVGSIAGRLPTPWLAAYTAAKHGVRGFMRALQVELRALDNPVGVALVAPALVDTPLWGRARTTDNRRMPRVFGAYRPEEVAREVSRALVSRRSERTVGAAWATLALLDALAPNVALRVIPHLAKIGWSHREDRRPNHADALTEPLDHAQESIGSWARPSVLVRLRDLARIGR